MEARAKQRRRRLWAFAQSTGRRPVQSTCIGAQSSATRGPMRATRWTPPHAYGSTGAAGMAAACPSHGTKRGVVTSAILGLPAHVQHRTGPVAGPVEEAHHHE